MIDEHVWAIFVSESGGEFPYYHKKSGKFVGMNGIYPEHFHFRDDYAGGGL